MIKQIKFLCFSFDRQIEQKKRKKEDLTERWMDDLIQQPYNIHI